MIIPLPGGTQFDTGTDPTVVSVDDVTLHTPLALLRLIERWKGKPNLAAILASYTDQLQLLENALWDIITARLVDYAEGAQLDAIGRIVGEIRQGQNDAQYRARLRVRIRINQSFGTAEDVIIVLQMLDAALFAFVESGYAHFDIVYSAPLTSPAVASQVPKIIKQTRAAGIGATVTIPTDATRGGRYGTALDPAFNQHIGAGTVLDSSYGGLSAHVANA
jgi:hypothetical protein